MNTDEHGLFSDFSSVLIRVIPWSLFPSFSVVVYSVFSVALVLERKNVQRTFRGDGHVLLPACGEGNRSIGDRSAKVRGPQQLTGARVECEEVSFAAARK